MTIEAATDAPAPCDGLCSCEVEAEVHELSFRDKLVPRGGGAVLVTAVNLANVTRRLRVTGKASVKRIVLKIAKCLGTVVAAAGCVHAFQPEALTNAGELHKWAVGAGVCFPLAAPTVDIRVWTTLDADDMHRRRPARTEGDLRSRWKKAKIRGAAFVHDIWTARNKLKPPNLQRHRR